MILIYINELGLDYKNQKQYEFIFSESQDLDIDEWFTIPASSTSVNKCPDVSYVSLVGILKDTDIELELIQNSDYFGVIDAVDGVISLGWEKFDYDIETERLYFRFGESVESVASKLKKRDYQLLKEEIKINE